MSETLADTLRTLYSAEQYAQIIAAIRRENPDLIKYLDLECRKLGHHLERYDRWDAGHEGQEQSRASGAAADDTAHDTRLVLRLRAQLLDQLDATYRRQLEDAAQRQERQLRLRLRQQYEEHHDRRLRRHIRRVLLQTVGAVLLCAAAARGLALLLPGPDCPDPPAQPPQCAADGAPPA